METWQEMKDRHNLERAEAVAALRDAGMTQTQAAAKLEMSLTGLNNYLRRNRIPWRCVRQGLPRHVQ